jgi:IS30 family transposase
MNGKQEHSVLVTLVERRTRFTVAIKAVNKTARAVTDAICEHLKSHQKRVLT